MKVFCKMLYGTTSYGSRSAYKYETETMLTCYDFDEDPSHNYGGFFVADKNVILRFLTWGTTLYNVIVPDDAKIIKSSSEMLNTGVYKVDKMMLCDPITLNDGLVLKLVEETCVPTPVWFQIASLCALHGFGVSARKIISTHLNAYNADEAVRRYEKYYAYRNGFMFGNVQADISCAEDTYIFLLSCIANLRKDNSKSE